ncbi:MAG: SDR family oxidoreductase, partial [Sphaerochaetaceae bacterium]
SYKESGVVINITDTQVQRPTISRPSYYLSKADLSYQVSLLAKTCAPYVRVNGVAPGPIIPMSEKDLPYFNKREELNPLHHLAKVEDVVQAVDFLICNQSITGVVIPVDAGEHLL